MQPQLSSVILRKLQNGVTISEPALLVVAHPDDESLGMGGRLSAFTDIALIQLTDGAPRDGRAARRAGFACWQRCAEERENEARSAMDRLGACLAFRTCCGLPDQEAVASIPAIVGLLTQALAGISIVFTHPYEGGHPDHDAAALAVQRACQVLRSSGVSPPLRFEFASYHEVHGRRVTGRFWTDPSCPAVDIRLSAGCLDRKRQALACYASQADIIAWFDPALESYRPAPHYNCRLPPPPGAALYDRFGWHINSELWREQAAAADTLEAQRCGG